MQLAWESDKGTLIPFVLQLTSVTNTNSKIAYKIKTFSTTSKAKVVKSNTSIENLVSIKCISSFIQYSKVSLKFLATKSKNEYTFAHFQFPN